MTPGERPVNRLGDHPGQEARERKGWFGANKWLVLRRVSQVSILALFLIGPLFGPLFGIWIVKGNLASSLTLDFLPLTDPLVFLQTILAGHDIKQTALLGAVIVVVFYLLVGGRVYCSWVCPVNVITDAAHWLRERLGLKGGAKFSRKMRYWVLAMILVLATALGSVAWELVNPVSMTFRGIVFGVGFAWAVMLAVFAFDVFVSRRGWCGHLCPVGAFYSLLGRFSLLRVSAKRRTACDDCMDCFVVCPEPQVIQPALKGADKGHGEKTGPVILAANCTNCARCIDVCAEDVFAFTTRFDQAEEDGNQSDKAAGLRHAA